MITSRSIVNKAPNRISFNVFSFEDDLLNKKSAVEYPAKVRKEYD